MTDLINTDWVIKGWY